MPDNLLLVADGLPLYSVSLFKRQMGTKGSCSLQNIEYRPTVFLELDFQPRGNDQEL